MSKLTERQKRTLDQLERKIDLLPVLPAVITELASLDPDSRGFADAVEKLCRSDPPFAARVLRETRADEPDRPPVLTIGAAISRVGARRLAELVTSLSVMRVFVPSTPKQRNLWLHALQVAIAARRIAQLRPELGVPPEQAYLAGLLHDVGRFVMFEQRVEELGAVDETDWRTPRELVETEIAICGYDHAYLGWLACRCWSLPEQVASLIREHHVYEESDPASVPPEMKALLSIIQQSDMLSFLVLRFPELLRESGDARRKALEKHCVHSSWTEPPLAPHLLAEQVPDVIGESMGIARELGLVRPHVATHV